MTTTTTTTTTTATRGPDIMTTTTTPTTTPTPTPSASAPFAESVAAIRGMREGADRWTLADALLAEVGRGRSRRLFAGVVAASESAGVKPLSVSAMRQYRDTAARYPAATRVEGVSFSAHRAALAASDPSALLADLARNAGAPEKVSVANVRDAVAIANGATPPSAKSPTSPGSSVMTADSATLAGVLARRASNHRNDVVAAIATLSTQEVEDLAAVISAAVKSVGAKSAKRAVWGTSPATPATSAVNVAPTPAVSANVAPSASAPNDLRGL